MSEEKNMQPAQEQELSEILQIRRDKLSALQQEGRDPFQQTKFVRTAWSEEIKGDFAGFENKTVSVRHRAGEDLGAMSLDAFAALLKEEVDSREIK